MKSPDPDPPLRFAVVTASDKGSRGERADRSGDLVVERLVARGASLMVRLVVADEREALAAVLRELCDRGDVDVVLTTGGTGFTERDVTPEATRDIIEREVPGIPEALRAEGLKKTPHAMLSRGVAGLRGRTLVVNLPGSTKAVAEGLDVLEPVLDHAVETLRSRFGVECGR